MRPEAPARGRRPAAVRGTRAGRGPVPRRDSDVLYGVAAALRLQLARLLVGRRAMQSVSV